MVNGLLTLALMPVLVIWWGFVVMKLWGWHVVPVFGMPALTWNHSVGCGIVLAMFRADGKSDGEQEDAVHWFMKHVVAYGILLLVGWLAA